MHAVVVDASGAPALAELPMPAGPGELVRVRACGLCGSDVEKLTPANAGLVLGHEVVAETAGGRRVALVHHHACGECRQCLAGHESLCPSFSAPTIVPGGFAEHVAAQGWIELPDEVDDARGTMVEPLACVLRGARAVPPGRALIVGNGFIGHLFGALLRHRGDAVFAIDTDERRTGPEPDDLVDTVILAGRGGVETALEWARSGGTILVFADAGEIPAAPIYRRELTIVGVRSASPAVMRDALALLPHLELPEPVTLPLARFADGLELFRRRDALKVVFTTS
ncbi:MAG: alcohol dehydrogenase catalytic domain-containing protein [Gaiellales bacterium]